MPGQTGQPRISQARVVFGLVVMLVGTLLLLDRLEWWGVRLNVPLWPWVLVVLGLVRLSDRSPDGRRGLRVRRSAVWVLFVGAWGLLNEYRLFGIHYGHSWPILLIGAGVLIVWRATDQSTSNRSPNQTCTPARREPNHG